MQYLFEEVGTLDKRCYERFSLTEDLLMEHAADGMADYIRNSFAPGKKISIVCGSGNNGADGIALARILHGDYDVSLLLPRGAKSEMARLQLQRAEALGLTASKRLEACDLLVDALFGTGFSGTFDEKTVELLTQMNRLEACKIACDIPSGLHLEGTLEPETFVADTTLTMGALKRGMFSDAAKDVTGEIRLVDLGISRKNYETPSLWHLLDRTDLRLPHRARADTHKGTYGHLGLLCGEKEGAAVIAASAALRFGAGLVTLISNEQVTIPYELMQSHLLPATTTALVMGMGLGQEFAQHELDALLDNTLPLVLDADIFSHPMLPRLLKRDRVVLTPHPKEFATLLRVCGLSDITAAELQQNRFSYVKRFADAYPHVTLLLKGANVIIAGEGKFFVNPHGSSVLAKGGSGDVLSGLIGALLAQGHSPLEAALNGSLAHTEAAAAFAKNSYALTPHDLIEALAAL
jgi:hydroxyethylthiazole kinase-like uncharacterized protein yjeF